MKQTLLAILSLFAVSSFAQVTLLNGHHVLELSGGVSTYYNNRSLKPGETDRSKDRFKLRDAQIELEGRVGADFEYDFKVDFADMAAQNSTGEIDPENPGLMEATVTYKGFHFVDIEMGYGKLYYSRSALVPFDFSPYWQRPELTRGSIFSTRDVGITLMKNFWKQRANVYIGAYTGLGELSLSGDNDASGQLEYVGRVDVSYPARYRYREIDDRHSPIPMFSLGLNGRYANKKLPEGEVFPDQATGEYGLKVTDGKRYVYGLDASFQYMGLSAQFEIHQIKQEPQSPNDPLFQNLTAEQTKGYVLSGGYIAQLNYFIKPIDLIVSARYEELDLNDLVPGNSQRFSPAIAYQINGYNAMIKAQYFHINKEETIDPLKWDEQYRIGMVFQFK
ncbi:MAG TPA: porin [Flavobacterium sp.]|nr:porin [Flavobacterium sp.]